MRGSWLANMCEIEVKSVLVWQLNFLITKIKKKLLHKSLDVRDKMKIQRHIDRMGKIMCKFT